MESNKDMNTSAPIPLRQSFETIDLSRTFDKTYWAHRLQIAEEELIRVVRAAGPRSDRVQKYLEELRKQREEEL